MTIVQALEKYHAKSAANAYMIAFHARKSWYLITVDKIPLEWVKFDRIATSKAKKGISPDLMFSLRLNMTKAVRETLAETAQAERITADFLALEKNKGRAIERYIRERNGLQHSNDNIPFWKVGDLTLNGAEIQVKYENAQLSPLWNL